MEVISPFDFLDMFPERRSLIFVGNAPSLKGARLGDWIDSHDMVVRFNEAKLSGFSEDVGIRTDILVTNPYMDGRTGPALEGSSCRAVLVIARMNRRGDAASLVHWLGRKKVLFTYTPDPGQVGTPRVGGMTTGVAGFVLLKRVLKPSAVSLTGFTMFLDDTSHHYWSGATPPGVEKHDMSSNAVLLIELLNAEPHATMVTEEIAWMARKVGRALSKRIEVKLLPNGKWNAS